MVGPNLSVQLSEIDSERFGIVIARAPSVNLSSLPTIFDYCRAHKVKMLIARCNVNELDSVHEMEQSGFRLMDTLLYYRRDLVTTPIPQDMQANIVRPAVQSDKEQVKRTARAAFQDYLGHYHADPRLDRDTCNDIYPSWAERAVESRGDKDEVLVVERANEILGLAVLHLNSAQESDALLFAIAPEAQRQGIYRSLLIHCMQWSLFRGTQRLISSTQITNTASQKSWTRVGFEFSHAFYTFHKWFD